MWSHRQPFPWGNTAARLWHKQESRGALFVCHDPRGVLQENHCDIMLFCHAARLILSLYIQSGLFRIKSRFFFSLYLLCVFSGGGGREGNILERCSAVIFLRRKPVGNSCMCMKWERRPFPVL